MIKAANITITAMLLTWLWIFIGVGCTDGHFIGSGTVPATVTTISQPVSGPAKMPDVSKSACYKYQWKNRGQAPLGYIEGMTKTFANALCNPKRYDVIKASMAKTGVDTKDALSWYNSNFNSVGMKNDTSSVDTLRHTYTLLIGLGMRESSGKWCCGRDASATNTSSMSAEAGTFQTSLDSKSSDPGLLSFFLTYDGECFFETFSRSVTCSESNLKNWGTGEGMAFQEKNKKCPAFAAQYASALIRLSGGTSGHYGPLRRKEAEIRPECDELLKQIQMAVESNKDACK